MIRAVPVMSMVCVQGIIKLLCGTVLEDDVQQPLLESPTLITFILDACKNQLDLVIHLSLLALAPSLLLESHFLCSSYVKENNWKEKRCYCFVPKDILHFSFSCFSISCIFHKI